MMANSNTPGGKPLFPDRVLSAVSRGVETAKMFFAGFGREICLLWDRFTADGNAGANASCNSASKKFNAASDDMAQPPQTSWYIFDRKTVQKTGAEEKAKPAVKDILGKVWNVFTWLIVVLAVAAALLFVGVRLIGYTPYTVLSGSMEPKYMTGSLIYVKKVAAEDIKVGDSITFVMNEEGTVATHRVYEIDKENRVFRTKGINNKNPDPAPVLFENLIGKPADFSIPYLGFASNYFSEPPGMYIGITGVLILLILFFLPDILRSADAADAKDKQKKSALEEETSDASLSELTAEDSRDEYDDSEYDDSEYDDSEYDDSEYDDSEYDDSEYDDSEYDDSEYDNSEYDGLDCLPEEN